MKTILQISNSQIDIGQSNQFKQKNSVDNFLYYINRKITLLFSRREFKTHDILVGRNYSPKTRLYSLEDFQIKGDLEIQLSTGKALHIPKWLQEQILDFINHKQPYIDIFEDSYDCKDFACDINGIDHTDLNQWKSVSQNDIHLLEAGSTIYMADSHNDGFHYALYLGEGFFISKIKKHGYFSITTLENLQEIYRLYEFAIIKKEDES